MNILLLFLSFFNFSTKGFFSKEISFQDCIYQYDKYYLYNNENYDLYYEDKLLRSYPKNTNIKIINANEHSYVFSIYNGKLVIEEYNQKQQLLVTKQFDDLFVSQFNIYAVNKHLFFIGGITEYHSQESISQKKDYFGKSDAIIFSLDANLKIDKLCIYGGELNEQFLDAKFINGEIYLTFKKDMLTGGDFGNGGGNEVSYGLCQLNQDFAITNLVTVRNETIFDFFIDEEVIIATDSKLYRLDNEFLLEESIKFPFKSIFVHLTPNKLAIVFGQTQAKFYDLQFKDYIDNFTYEEVKKIKIVNHAYLFDYGHKRRCFKLYDIRNIPNSYVYQGEIIKPQVFDMFRNIETEIGEINPYFNPLIYGDYQVQYLFDGNVIIQKIHIPLSVNVSEGIIYPLRYHLKFTGTAILNNVEIMNNHCITSPGEYRLELIGCHQEITTIHFQVAKEQIVFTESTDKDWDYVVNLNDPLILQMPYQIDERFTILNVWINDETFPCNFEDGLLKVELPTDIAGIREYNFQGITYSYNDKLYQYQINQKFTVNVLRDDLEIITEVINEEQKLNFYLTIDDPDYSLRGISIVSVKNGRENRYCFPIANGEITFPPSGRGEIVHININYDQGDGVLKEVEIFKITLESAMTNIKIGEINLLSMEKYHYRILISIPIKRWLKEIIMNQEIIHRYLEDDYTANISMGLIIGFTSMVIIRKFRKRKLKKRLQNR